MVHASPDVTLEEDLARRDLTINAIAAPRLEKRRPSDRPYGGVADLRAGVLRHVTDAFREDPVHLARGPFAARFAHFMWPRPRCGAHARDGARGRGPITSCPSAWARKFAWPDGAATLAHVRGAARVRLPWRACCPSWIACGACPSAPTTTPKWTPASTPCWCWTWRRGCRHRWPCALPACATTWAKAPPCRRAAAHIGRMKNAARACLGVCQRWRAHRLPRTGRRGSASTATSTRCTPAWARQPCCACWALTRRAAQARAL